MRPTVTKFSKQKPGEENTHESCAKTRQSSHKNSTWSMPSWINLIWKKRFYWGLLLACERPTGQQSISSIPHSKGYEFSFILRGDIFDIWGRFAVIAVYNAYRFFTERINTSTVFVHVSDRVTGTGQTANTSRRTSTGDFSRYIACKHKNNHKNAKKTFFLFI